ncbi:MAG: hypothetical protein ABIM74_06040, partial [candidate division WOR-3 bacterium]
GTLIKFLGHQGLEEARGCLMEYTEKLPVRAIRRSAIHQNEVELLVGVSGEEKRSPKGDVG